MRIHASQGLSEDVDGVIREGIRPRETLEEHETARYADRLVQTRREHAAPERQVVLFRPGGHYVSFYHLKTNNK